MHSDQQVAIPNQQDLSAVEAATGFVGHQRCSDDFPGPDTRYERYLAATAKGVLLGE